ncbi:hypothetical protein FMUND_13614 [Fusarium mundagurra]|uniref:Uncharacterized protein n=1 Tax=Fusarium mundagurra TaxID=1567541 RepID=A0A8H6D3E0_9HYPO|nr:hypothetical protein FMUND_13614 [Fusarium mundagurra]
METKNEHSQESGQLARNTEGSARRSRSPRPSLESRPGAVRHRSPARRRSTFPMLLKQPRVPPLSSTQITPLRSTEMPHRGRQRERSPTRQQVAPASVRSTQDGRDRAPSHATMAGRLIKELKASVESQKKDIQNLSERATKIEVEKDRKIKEQEGLIKKLQKKNRILKQQLDAYVTGNQSDSFHHHGEA